MSLPTANLVFFGTPTFAAGLLEALSASGFCVVAAVTRPDRQVGRQQNIRQSPVKLAAERLHIQVCQPEKIVTLAGALQKLHPDVGILFSYGAILPTSVLQIFPRGILNLHPSLLPKYRGPSPVPQAILDGVAETGVSIIRLDAELDHGPVLAQSRTRVGPDETTPELLNRLAALGSEMLTKKVLSAYLSGSILPLPQDDRLATYSKTLRREDGSIDWTQSAQQIYRQYRALFFWPGVFTNWKNRRLKICRLRLASITGRAGTTGMVARIGTNWMVHCGQGGVILDEVQLEGGVQMPLDAFLRGHPDFSETILR